MTDEQVERYGKAWEAGEREDRVCGLCGNVIQPGQWMCYHYHLDGSRAIEHVDCDHPEKDQDADYLRVTPLKHRPFANSAQDQAEWAGQSLPTSKPGLDEAKERALPGARGLNVPGSPEWCWQTINLLKTYYQYVGNRWQEVMSVLVELAEHRAWEKVPSGKPYGSEDELLKSELGISKGQVEDLDRLLAGDGEPQHQRIRTRGGSPRKQAR